MKLVIVGAGFAGISTAYHLARRGVRDIVVVEREVGPGHHASGKNAGLLRQSESDEALVPLLREGSRAARRILKRSMGSLVPSGSLIMGKEIAALRAGPRAEVVEAGTLLEGLDGEALFDPQDAIVDPHSLLREYELAARRRGVEFSYLEELVGVETAGGRIVSVETARRTLPARGLVVAAGAWAGRVAGLAGSRSIPIRPLRRHIFHGRLAGRDCRRWPFVWNTEQGVYFLPEGEGLLLSACDTDPHAAEAPALDPNQRAVLAEKLERNFGRLGEWSIGPGWACLRTFTADPRFLIGPDPSVHGLFWVGALGGHGMTASWAVGKYAAEVYLGRRDAGPFDPRRF